MGPSFGRRDPDSRGYYGEYGGRFVPETLVAPVEELERSLLCGAADAGFRRELAGSAARLRRAADAALRGAAADGIARRRAHLPEARGPRPHRRAQDQQRARAGAARRSGWESGVSSPRPAPGSTASRPPRSARCSGLECDVYMGAEDMERQSLNVFRMRLLGAEVPQVDAGARTLKDAINEAMRDWVTNVADTLLPARLGARSASLSADGPRVPVGHRPGGARAVSTRRPAARRRSSPASAAAATPWASSTRSSTSARAAGRCRSGGRGITPGQHAARFAGGSAGVLQGTRSYVLQDDDGNIELTHSISAGLDYAAVGPEHAWLHDARPRRIHLDRRRRGADGVPAPGARRRHPARARVVARDRARVRLAPRMPPRSDAARQSVGPRRQGRPERAESARQERTRWRASTARVRAARAQRRARAASSPTSRPAIPIRRDRREILMRARARRRRRARSRRAVLGSAGRRAGHPARHRARPRRRR